MRPWTCDAVRDHLPALAADRPVPAWVDAHRAGCAACAEELELLRLLGRHRVVVPDGLDRRVVAALRTPLSRRFRVRHGLATAALLAAALLAGRALLDRDARLVRDAEPYAPVAPGPGLMEPFTGWPAADGLLAGSIDLSDLSTEELQQLSEELQRLTEELDS